MTFQERIDAQMDAHYSHVPCKDGGHTIGALIGAVLQITTEADAQEFYHGYLAHQRQFKIANHTPEQVVRMNIGWCFGEGMPPDQIAMWSRVCGASHPVFGTTLPTPEAAFAAGVAAGATR